MNPKEPLLDSKSPMSQKNVFLIGVARIDSGRGLILGSCAYNDVKTDLNGIKQVLEQPNMDLQAGKHYTFTISEVTWHIISGIHCVLLNLQF
jgi:hypothetical protein